MALVGNSGVCTRSCFRCQAECSADIVSGAGREALELLDNGKVSRFYQRGDELYSQGGSLPGLFCISSARVKLVAVNRAGKVQIVGLAGPGEMLGLPLVFSSEPASHSALVLAAGVICTYPVACIKAALQKDPEVTQNVLSSLARLQVDTEGRLLSLSGLSAPARIAKLILDQATSTGVVTGLSRTEISQLAGTTLETVSRMVRSLARGGQIKVAGRRIQVLDRAGIEELVARG